MLELTIIGLAYFHIIVSNSEFRTPYAKQELYFLGQLVSTPTHMKKSVKQRKKPAGTHNSQLNVFKKTESTQPTSVIVILCYCD